MTFKAHFQATAPGPSWTAWKRRQTGVLTVHADHAEFQSRTGERLAIRDVTSVPQPSRAELRRQHDISWLVNTWIAVHYSIIGQPYVAFFNDGRLLGHYLSHGRMRCCLDALVGISTDS
jgi:hypothetical protein